MAESGNPSDTGAPTTPGWQAPPSSSAPVPGAPGFVYAGVRNRAVAYVIDDIIILVVVGVVYQVIKAALGHNAVSYLVGTVVGLAISAAYFTYTWTTMRGTVGMRALGMQIGNAGDGATLKQGQAVRRWLILFGPSIVAEAVLFSLGLYVGFVVWMAVVAWYIFLVKTTADSPTKQGYHDIFANTQVVKAGRNA